ncbi:hypothetical protein [Leptospira stimsonii]|uniref:hypothetical protein n=1 Tax=Leptospira stimsonii TaxID=2202203 RepID=UPI0011C39330|nr:hypothetical protein [Leptospira stimsonii]
MIKILSEFRFFEEEERHKVLLQLTSLCFVLRIFASCGGDCPIYSTPLLQNKADFAKNKCLLNEQSR